MGPGSPVGSMVPQGWQQGWEVPGPLGAPPRALAPQTDQPGQPRGRCGETPVWRSLVSHGPVCPWSGCGGRR